MKKTVLLMIVFLFMLLNIADVSQLGAQEAVVEKIASVSKAKEIAAKAGGQYIEGVTAPALTDTQVALPVINESNGEVLGHIIADKDALISTLNEAGYQKVGSALVAAQTTAEAGEAAGFIAEAGISAGTIGAAAATTAGAIGIAIAVSGGGSGGSDASTTTTHH